MYFIKYLLAIWKDWLSLMSGLAGVVFSFWTAFTDPHNIRLKQGLWVTTIACFCIASYRVWENERRKVERLQKETDKEANQIIGEFAEIRMSLLTSSVDFFISKELQRLKLFLHKHAFLLNRSDISEFYLKWVLPYELPLQLGAPITLTSAQWQALKEHLIQIDLRSQSAMPQLVTATQKEQKTVTR